MCRRILHALSISACADWVPSAVVMGSVVTRVTESGIVSGEAAGLFLARAVEGWPAGEAPVCRVFKAHGARRPMIEAC